MGVKVFAPDKARHIKRNFQNYAHTIVRVCTDFCAIYNQFYYFRKATFYNIFLALFFFTLYVFLKLPWEKDFSMEWKILPFVVGVIFWVGILHSRCGTYVERMFFDLCRGSKNNVKKGGTHHYAYKLEQIFPVEV